MLSSETIQKIIEVLSWTVLIYMILVIIFYSSLYLISAQMVRKQRFRRKESSYLPLMRSLYTRPVSVLVPAYNEEYTIVTSIQALLALDYPEHEVIVINDGSSDGTMDELFKVYELEEDATSGEKVKVIRKEFIDDKWTTNIKTYPINEYYKD